MVVMQYFNTNGIFDVCRNMELFTVGTNEEFHKLYDWNEIAYSDEVLFDIANYIYKYSNKYVGVVDIAGEILRNGVTRYIEEEEI